MSFNLKKIYYQHVKAISVLLCGMHIIVAKLPLYTIYMYSVEVTATEAFFFSVSQRISGFSTGSTRSCSSVVLSLRAKYPLLSPGSLLLRSMSEKRSLNSTSLQLKKSLKSLLPGIFKGCGKNGNHNSYVLKF